MVKASKLVIGLMIAILLVCMFGTATQVHAAEFAKTNIDVRCRIDKNIPSGHTFTYELKAGNEATPMPEGSEAGIKTVEMTKSGKVDFGDISYDHPEVYYYYITETTGEWKNFKPCQIEYTAIVIITTDGQVQTVIKDSRGEKYDKILLKNSFDKKEKEKDKEEEKTNDKTSAQTGDNIKYIAMGIAAGMFIMFMILTILKRIATTGHQKIREFK